MGRQAYKAFFVRVTALKLRKLWFSTLLNELIAKTRPYSSFPGLHMDNPRQRKHAQQNIPYRS